jgi:peptidoglycan/LPS O-acetylase OafA/YrhL
MIQNINKNRIYFPELDGLRFFAFLLVFIHHQNSFSHIQFLSWIHKYGWIGVDLFFVLSSFLFTKLLVSEYNQTQKISIKKFYLRRIFRIWPIYYFYVFISILLLIFYSVPFDFSNCLRIFGLITFSDNILTSIYGYNTLPLIAHFWTISYEEQFYFFIPLIILILVRSTFKRKMIILITTFVLLNFIRFSFFVNHVEYVTIWVLPLTHFESIILGIVIGFGGFDFLFQRINPLVIGVIGFISGILICFLPDVKFVNYWLILTYGLVGVSTSFIFYSVKNSLVLKKIFSHKILVFLGKRSFGLYVYHILGNKVASLCITHISFLPSHPIASSIYSFVFTLVASVISYKILERPFLKLKEKYEIIKSRPI